MEERPVKTELIILISTDKGLCGALNTNLFRETSTRDQNRSAAYVASGRKGTQYLARTKRNLLADFPAKDNPSLAETRQISKFALDRFLSGEVQKVSVAYTKFINTLNQKPTIQLGIVCLHLLNLLCSSPLSPHQQRKHQSAWPRKPHLCF